MGNYIKYYLRNLLYQSAILITTGSVLQLFLTNLGIDSGLIGVYTSLMSAVNVVISITLSSYADIRAKFKGTMSVLCILIGISAIGFLPLCIISVGREIAYAVVIAIGVSQAVMIALFTIFDYKLPYAVIDMNRYGKFLATNGILCGIMGALFSTFFAYTLKHLPYYTVMGAAFVISALCMLAAAGINQSLRETYIEPPVKTEQKVNVLWAVRALFGMKSFRYMIMPNFTRGISMGIISMTAVLTLKLEYSNETVARIVTCTLIGTIFGCMIYRFLVQHISNKVICLCGSIVMLAAILLRGGNEKVFLVLYTTVMVGKCLVDYSIPSRIYEIISPDIACTYHSWRMIVTTAGSALASVCAGFLVSVISPQVLFCAAAALQLYCGCAYYLFNEHKQQ